jgi:hypothetical protein
MKLYRLIDENNPGEIEYIATPVEITEEEIADELYSVWYRDARAVTKEQAEGINDLCEAQAKAILSKLQGE